MARESARRMVRRIALFVLAALLSGCLPSTAILQARSAKQVDCPADRVAISNAYTRGGHTTWYAECRGQLFLCAEVNDGVACARPVKITDRSE
jgi:hypothetical protein